MQQQTIATNVTLSGIGLHSGQEVTLNLYPAPADHGIVFVRSDLPARPRIAATIANLHQRMRCTALVADNAEVHTTEHLLATCLAMGIDNMLIEIDGPEVPGMDGSALLFYQALAKAGKQKQDQLAHLLILDQKIEVSGGNASLVARPHDQTLQLEYYLEYDVYYLKPQHIVLAIDEATFAKEIAPARTFALKEEVAQLVKAGLGKGANVKNTLIIDEDGNVVDNQLRFADEFARHKTLDLLGDLALLGRRLQAHIVARRSGHTLNAALVQKLSTVNH